LAKTVTVEGGKNKRPMQWGQGEAPKENFGEGWEGRGDARAKKCKRGGSVQRPLNFQWGD